MASKTARLSPRGSDHRMNHGSELHLVSSYTTQKTKLEHEAGYYERSKANSRNCGLMGGRQANMLTKQLFARQRTNEQCEVRVGVKGEQIWLRE